MRQIILDADVRALDSMTGFLEEALEALGYGFKAVSQIALAAEEVFVNIATYAYAPNAGKVVIRLRAEDQLYLEFEDEGVPYDPLEKRDPDLSADAMAREIGGLGIFMVKKVMDGMEYRREDGKNKLTLKKALPGE